MRSIGRVISDEFHGRSRWRKSFRPNRANASPFGSTATVRSDSGRCSMVLVIVLMQRRTAIVKQAQTWLSRECRSFAHRVE